MPFILSFNFNRQFLITIWRPKLRLTSCWHCVNSLIRRWISKKLNCPWMILLLKQQQWRASKFQKQILHGWTPWFDSNMHTLTTIFDRKRAMIKIIKSVLYCINLGTALLMLVWVSCLVANDKIFFHEYPCNKYVY